MAINETAKSTVILDSKQAEESLKKLQVESKELRQEMKKLREANDLAGYEKLRKEADANTKAQKALKQELFSLEKVLNNLSGSSLNQLKSAQRTITAELNKMTRGTQEYIEKSKQLRQVTAEIGKVRTEMNGAAGAQQGFFNRASNGFNKYFGMITAGVAAFTGVIFGVRKAIDSFNEFEKSVSTLSSLTGLAGDDLKWLADQAKLLSTSTTESGVRITSSATDIVEAYKLMGSARPELLQNKEDLNNVTKQALILKEAAGIELNEAVQAVASSMNQFNLNASQSERVINALAAGALVGASEIGDLTGSMKNVGAVAKDSNMSLEQTVAALEVLGSKALKGEEAGTKLRGALLKMKDAGLGYASGQFNMADALEEANKKILAQGSALDQDALKIKYFGAENVTAGTILLNNVGMYKSLTTAVTGTSEATKQAGINTDNNSAKLDQAKNKAQLTAIAFGEKLAPALTFSTNGFSYLMKIMLAIIRIFETHGRLILTTTSAIIAYTIAVKIQTLAQSLNNKESTLSLALSKLRVFWDNALRSGTLLLAAAQAVLTGNLGRANAAMVLLNQTTKLNPIGLLVAVIAAVVVGLAAYSKKIADVNASQKMLIDLNVEAKKSIAGEKTEMERLLIIARDEKRTKDDRIAAIKKLNELSPEYLGGLTLENIGTKEAIKSTEEYIKMLEKKAMAQAAQEKMVEIEKELIDLQANGAGTKWYQDIWNAAKSGGNMAVLVANDMKTLKNNYEVALKELTEKKKALMGVLTLDVNSPSAITPDAPKVTGVSDEDIKKMLESLDKAYQQRKLLIMKQRAENKITQDQYDQKLLAEEVAYLYIKLEALKKNGKDTIEVEQQIAEKQIALQNKITEAKDKANKEKEKSDKEYFDSELERLKNEEEAIWNQVLEQEKADEYAHQQKAQYYENLKGITDNLGAAMGETIVNMATNAEMTSQDFAKAMILIAIDALHATVRMAIAEIWAKQIASKGFVGIGTSIVLSALVEAAFAGVKAGITNAGKTKQRASGKYDVIGEEDGRSYSAAWGGPMQTGIYTQPTLVAERGNELVVDAGTLRNLQVNFPAVIPTIRAAMVPQRASGNVSSIAPSTASDPEQKAINRMIINSISRLDSTLRKGIKAGISYTNVKDSLAKGQEAEDMGSKG